MEKQGTYLYERTYIETGAKDDLDPKAVKYWEAILGRNVLEMLIEGRGRCFQYLCEKPYMIEGKQKVSGLRTYLEKEADRSTTGKQRECCRDRGQAADEELFFPDFYRPFCTYAVLQLKEKLRDDVKYISGKVWESFEMQIALHLQQVCLRTLIVEMHAYKEKGYLVNGTPKQEYRYFCETCIRDGVFIQSVADAYPVLLRCVEERIDSFVGFYAEVVGYFKEDMPKIQDVFSPTEELHVITDIRDAASDLHNNGKQVLRITLDHGLEILFKPRSMENESKYMKLLDWVSEKTGIRQYRYAFLSYAGHSWCRVVSYEGCQTEDALRRYYRRLGSQLFLIYLLGTKDLHSENVIAHGEYPVLIDLETLVNIQYNQKRETAFQEICYQLANSVLYTGLLPFYYFNQEGEGVNSSAISGGEGQKYPFKIPTVIHPRTSDMKIAYRYPVSKKAGNLAMLEGEFISPSRYGEDLLGGFRDTYLAVVGCREMFRLELAKLMDSASRYLIQDTQRYGMLLSTSCHPEFLTDGAKREMFLHSLWKGRLNERREVIDCEIKSLLQGDIPYFYYYLDDTALMAPGGIRIKNYFDEAPANIVFAKLDALGSGDMERQCEYIRMSLDLMPDCAERFENRCYKVGKTVYDYGDEDNGRRIGEFVRNLRDRLVKYAIWNHKRTEVSWFTIQLSAFGKPSWEAKPMNMYLYDGLAGMLLIFHELKKMDRSVDVYYGTIRCMLFRYTDFMYGEAGKNVIRDTGMYEGEASIVYVYCLMYGAGGGEEYLAYAKKHAAVVERLLEHDKRYDLMAGNAGAALAFVYLYEITGDGAYLQHAERGMELLMRHAVRMEHGIGWLIERGFPPFAGMAHGGSGIMMPAAALWKHTGKEKYRLLMEQILEYDESLFDETIQNWTDIRGGIPGDEYGAVAWCHGAGGILLSRVFCWERTGDGELKRRLERDVIRAYRKLADYWKRDSWGLCHGSCGNVWILQRTKKAVEELIGEVEIPDVLNEGEEISFLPQEKLNPGLMNGYGGVLMYLLKIFQEL